MKYQAPRGTHDQIPPGSVAWKRLQTVADRVFPLYGMLPLETPVFEHTDLFTRSLGEETDIVSKEMYTFQDRKGRSLTLRPEGTASAVRAYLQGRLGEQGFDRFYYFGPMFRYERPQAGRTRQFYQIGVELFGDAGPSSDVEVIESLHRFCHELGLRGLVVQLNSVGCPECRGRYVATLKSQLAGCTDDLCELCRHRLNRNPLRILDCKKAACRERYQSLPLLTSHLCGPCQEHFQGVQAGLTSMEVPFRLEPWLVRGLDYYTRTAFEVTSEHLGAQDALGGGGRYDLLVEQFGGPPTPAVGFAAGVERLLMVLEKTAPEPASPHERSVYAAALGDRAAAEVMGLSRRLRDAGIPCLVDTGPGSLKKKLKLSSKLGCRATLIVGDDEVEARRVLVKDMGTGEQELIDLEGVVNCLKEKA